MTAAVALLALALAPPPAGPLPPGDHVRRLVIDGRERVARVHVPPRDGPARPVPVVLAFHGTGMTAAMMERYSGLSRKADAAGFLAVYPQGESAGVFRSFNVGGVTGRLANGMRDDLAFVDRLLDDLATVAPVDPDRVYATGISNGGMFAYRLAAERADRVAAIAVVAGVATAAHPSPARPVPVLHIHGTEDRLVLYEGADRGAWNFVPLLSVQATIAAWAARDGCPPEPKVDELPDRADDATTVTRAAYGPGRDGAEVILLTVRGGGHTWPGAGASGVALGRISREFDAADVIWDFFRAHPRRQAVANAAGE
jgi:polyhydroxybutyrate depolymerase